MLRLAVLGRTGNRLNVLDLASMPLPVKQFAGGSLDEEEQKSDNPFEDTAAPPMEAAAESESDIDLDSIREFVATHYLPRASISLGFEVPYVRTFLLPVDKKDTPSKIRTKVVEEVGKSLNVELATHAISLTKASDKQVLAIARVEEPPLIDICASPQGSERRPPRINFVTSNEIALINLVRVHFRADPDDLVHVIHVDDDVTHFFVMRGNDIEYIAPSIQQGAHDAHLVSTLYNRVELTAESAGYLNPDRVVLSGKAEEIGLKEEILENNPEVIFHSLKKLRVGHSEDKDILRDMNNYLVPISLAWQELQPRNEHFYRLDVLPSKVREEQKRFKLAWHGYLLLLLLFVTVTALTVMGLQRQAEIATLSSALAFDRKQIEEQRIIVDQITELGERSMAIRTATTTLDTLLLNSELWTETLDTLAVSAGNLRDTWVSELKMNQNGAMTVTGYSLKRSSIPTFSDAIGTTTLREITVQEIGEAKVFRYDILLRPDSLYPYSKSRAARWHDSVSTALGNMAAEESLQTGMPDAAPSRSPQPDRASPPGMSPDTRPQGELPPEREAPPPEPESR